MEKLKHWQLFLIFFAPLFVALHVDNLFYKSILQSLSLAFIVIYLLAIGEYLQGIKKMKGQTFFRINCSYLVAVLILIENIGDLLPDQFRIISVALLAYALIALIQVIEHVAVLIRMNENKSVDNYKQKMEFMLLFFWPIGIWFLQPRINRIS